MLRKLIVSLLCACIIIGAVLVGFVTIYFAVPSRQATAEIELPDTVSDPVTSGIDTTEDGESTDTNTNIYVADVYQSLTLRSEASSDSEPITEEGLAPLTRMEVIEFVSDTDFAYVKVLDGDNKDLYGYVNSQYITRYGEPTIRAGDEEY